MGDALVAFDAGLPVIVGPGVEDGGFLALVGERHAFAVVAVSAFPGAVALHGFPDVFGEAGLPVPEFLRGVDAAGEVVEQFTGCADFADDHGEPVVGNVAVGAGGADAGGVVVVS